VLGVKPAFEDVDASSFLAFLFALLKTESCLTTKTELDKGYWIASKIWTLLDVRNPASRKPLDQAPTPSWGVTVSKGQWFLTGVCSNGFLFALFTSRTPHESKHPSRGGAEGKRTRYATV
jgi:hypothetical protein